MIIFYCTDFLCHSMYILLQLYPSVHKCCICEYVVSTTVQSIIELTVNLKSKDSALITCVNAYFFPHYGMSINLQRQEIVLILAEHAML